jgi:cytoskeletal protein CcmA (bactofilin family)
MSNFSNDSIDTDTIGEKDEGQFQLYISKGSRLTGVFRIQGMARIDGYVEGEIHADSKVYVGKDGVIVASINADSLMSQGPIRGDVVVREKVELLAPATLEGTIQTPSFTLEEGVRVTGHLNMEMATSEVGSGTIGNG